MSKSENYGASSLKRHEAQCSICQSPNRKEFEENFLRWSTVADWDKWRFEKHTVYRHAHALGLFEKRRENYISALERILETGPQTYTTAGNVVAATKVLLQLREKGEKAQRKAEETVANSGISSKSKAARAPDSDAGEGARAEVVPPQETTDSENVPEAVGSDADTQPKDFVPPAKASDAAETAETKSFSADNQQKDVASALKAFDTADTAVPRVEESVADEGSGGVITLAVKAEVPGDVPVEQPAAEPVEA